MPRSKSLLIAVLIAVIVLAGAAFAAYDAFCVARSGPARETIVEIAPGSTFGEAAGQVARAHVVSNLMLRVWGRFQHDENRLQAGALIFPAHETVADVYRNLTVDARTASLWVTIPEGYTAVQIEQRLRDAHLPGADGFAAYARHTHLMLDGESTPSLEGYLFPDTYLISRDAKAADIAAQMVGEFRAHLPADAAVAARKTGYRLPQIVTLASLIEREAQVESERPLMAGVYYHRLHIRMPLEVDATLEYALPRHETVIRMSDLHRDTPYNTYLHPGLPPTPIANPGAPAISAALHPVRTSYLYYVYKGGGRHAFAETYEEHQANIQRYLR